MSKIAFHELSRRCQLVRLRTLAETALRAFGVEASRLRSVQYWLNATYRVEGGGQQFALRVRRGGPGQRELIESEIVWIEALRLDAGVAVPQVVRTRAGETIVEVGENSESGIWYCTLFMWLEGRFRGRSLTGACTRQAGALLASIHEHSRSFRPTEHFVRPIWDLAAFMGGTLNVDLGRCRAVIGEANWRIVEAMRGVLVRELPGMERVPTTFGMIHGDFHQGNYLFLRDRTAVIDFDFCGCGYYLYDIGVAFSTLVGRYPDYERLREAFLEGYAGLRREALNDRESEVVEMFIAARKMARALWLADMAGRPGWEWSEERVGRELAYVREWLAVR